MGVPSWATEQQGTLGEALPLTQSKYLEGFAARKGKSGCLHLTSLSLWLRPGFQMVEYESWACSDGGTLLHRGETEACGGND